jgi:hypothetical protein
MVLFYLFGFLLYHIDWFIPQKLRNTPDMVYGIYGPMSSWVQVSYFDFGFIRRGLVGTILYPFSEQIKLYIFVATMIVALFIILGGLNYLFKKSQSDFSSNLILLLFAFSPLGAMQLGWSFGRFEYLNYAIIIFLLLFNDKLNAFIMSLLLCLGVLIHEAFIFYGWPIVFAVLMQTKLKQGDNAINSLKETLLVFCIPIGVAVWLFFFGSVDINAMGASRDIIELPTYSFLAKSNLITNLSHTDVTLIYCVTVFYIAAIFLLQRTLYKINNHPVDLIFLAPYACLILYFFGIDYMRWTGILFFLVILSTLYRYAQNEFRNRIPLSPSLVIQLLILGFPFFGPIGIVNPFPCLRNFFILLERI